MVNDHPSVLMMDASAVGIGMATLIGWLPALAALVTIIWTLIRIYETKTMQAFLRLYVDWAVLPEQPPTVTVKNVEKLSVDKVEVNTNAK